MQLPTIEEMNTVEQDLIKTNTIADNQQPDVVIVPIVHESLQLDKSIIETSKIHISKKVSSQDTEINIPLTTVGYDVNRIAINQVVNTPPPAVRYEGETMIISVVKEVLVVEKKYEITEELHIIKRTEQHNEIQQITLLKEEVLVERTPSVTENHNL